MLSRRSTRVLQGLSLLGAILVGATWLAYGQASRPGPEGVVRQGPPPTASLAPKLVRPANQPRRGAETPLLTIVEYSEFECPTCQRVANVLRGLLSLHPEDLAVVWMDCPSAILRPRSLIAAKFARAVYERQGNATFWTVHDELFRDLSHLRDADLIRLGGTIGFDAASLLSGPAESVESSIGDSVADARALGIGTTPAIFVNGRRAPSEPRTLGDFLKTELTRAQALERSGLTRAEVVAKLEAEVPRGSKEI